VVSSTPNNGKENDTVTRTREVLIAVGAIIVAFAIGFGWQYSHARRFSIDLQNAQHELGLQKLVATLGAATIDAQRGAYEPARQLASDFFTQLEAQKQAAPIGAQAQLASIALQRDAIITALSRNDPQSGVLLTALFTRLRIALGQDSAVSTIPAPAPAAPAQPMPATPPGTTTAS
jgi:hypothetical protein